MKSINPILLVFSVFFLIFVNRVYSVSLPSEFYFSFSSFLLDNRELTKLPALAAKLSQPFSASFLLMMVLLRSALFQRSLIGRDGSIVELAKNQAPLTLAFGAGLTAFLFAWPYILLWDLLIDPTLAPYRALYLLSYAAYVVGFTFFALSGAEMAQLVEARDKRKGISISSITSSDFAKPMLNALSGTVATAISTFFAAQVS